MSASAVSPFIPSNRELLVIGAGLAGLALAVYLIEKNASKIGQHAVDALGDVTAGAVIGVGDQIGLPDTSDAATVAQGQAAAAAGDWLTASLKLPAPMFFAAVKQRLFGSPASPDDNVDATNGAGSAVTYGP